MEPLLLGVDAGTSSVKAVLLDLRGNLCAVCQAEYPLHHLRSGWVEQEPEDWWQATCKAVRGALAKVEHGPERVLGMAVSSQAPTLLPLDRSGRPLRPAMIWMDRRAEAEAVRLTELIGAEEIYRITGNRPDAFYVAARLLWLRDHEPEVLKQTWKFVQVNGYINYRLTGRVAMDPAHAVLLQMRNYATGEWSEALCSACGVEPEQFPEVMEGHKSSGRGHGRGRRGQRTAGWNSGDGRDRRQPRGGAGGWRGRAGNRGGDDRNFDRRHHSQRPRADGACADRAAARAAGNAPAAGRDGLFGRLFCVYFVGWSCSSKNSPGMIRR